MEIPVETLSYVGVMAVMIGLMWRLYTRITDKHKADIDKISDECKVIQIRLTSVEAKQDMYLHELGFDVPIANSKISSYIEKLMGGEENPIIRGSTIVSLLDLEELKRKEGK